MHYFKNLLILLLFVFNGNLQVISQTYITAETQSSISQLKADWELYKLEDRDFLFKRYPLVYTNTGICVSMLGKVNHIFNKKYLPSEIILGSRVGDIITLKVPISKLDDLYSIEGLEILEMSRKIKPQIDRAVKDVRADSVHMGIDLDQAFTGKNVIIGVTDWGFDYTHPMFMDTALNTTRILAAWDQFRRSEDPPNGFNYGSEIDGSTSLASFEADTACLYYDYATHGSHVAGIAGGSGAGIGLRGVAFESNFLFSQFYLDAASSIDAVNWMKDYAEKEQKPLVVNMSWGLYHLGPLDGTSLLSEAFDEFSNEGVLIVTSGGNNGNVNFHLRRDFLGDTLKAEVDFYSYSSSNDNGGQSISAWGDAFEAFSIGFDIYDGSNLVAQSPYYLTTNSASYLDSFLVSGMDTIRFNIAIDASFPTNNSPHARLRIKNTNSNLKVVLKATAIKGMVHFWNVTELTNGAGNWGMPFTSFNGGAAGDAQYGVGEPAATKKVLTVAAHGSEVKLPNGTVNYGPLATFSSEGPTPDERIKPDVSAPGINILSSISSFTTASHAPNETLNFNGRTYHFSKFSGTSMASPAAAGVAVLLLEANPQLTPAEVKAILMNTAREDPKTGILPLGGSTEWGFGKVTATSALVEALKLTGTDDLIRLSELRVYPNPMKDYIRIEAEHAEIKSIEIRNITGELIYSLVTADTQIEIEADGWKPGIYVIRLNMKGILSTVKCVKL